MLLLVGLGDALCFPWLADVSARTELVAGHTAQLTGSFHPSCGEFIWREIKADAVSPTWAGSVSLLEMCIRSGDVYPLWRCVLLRTRSDPD